MGVVDELVRAREAYDRHEWVAAYDGLVCVDSSLGSVALTPVERFTDPSQQVSAGSLLAPMPGVVTRAAFDSLGITAPFMNGG